MNKHELTVKAAEVSGVTQKDAGAVLDAVFGRQGKDGVIVETVTTGEIVELVGFGNFGSKPRAARAGRNPQTGDVVPIPASVVPSFKPGKRYKDAVK